MSQIYVLELEIVVELDVLPLVEVSTDDEAVAVEPEVEPLVAVDVVGLALGVEPLLTVEDHVAVLELSTHV